MRERESVVPIDNLILTWSKQASKKMTPRQIKLMIWSWNKSLAGIFWKIERKSYLMTHVAVFDSTTWKVINP